MKKTLLVPMPILMLAACSEATSGPQRMADGRWEISASFDSVDAPGMTPGERAEVKRMMNEAMGQQGAAECMRHSGDQLQEWRNNLGPGAGVMTNCEHDADDRMSGGVFKLTASCRIAGGPGRAGMRLDGNYTADTVDGVVEISMDGRRPSGRRLQARLTGKMTGRRVGDC